MADMTVRDEVWHVALSREGEYTAGELADHLSISLRTARETLSIMARLGHLERKTVNPKGKHRYRSVYAE